MDRVYKAHAASADIPVASVIGRIGEEPSLADGSTRGGWTEKPTESERVYRALKRAILAGELRPGEPLQEVRIAAEYGASRTPIREAFQKLEGDGLLTIAPRRGAFVRQPTVRDFVDINELRLILEPVAMRAAATSLSPDVVAALQERLAEIAADQPSEADFVALEELDREMHRTVAGAHPNERMNRIIDGLNDMMQIVREKDMRRRHGDLHASIGDILDALAARDPDLAERVFRRHIGDFSGALRTLV